MLTGEVDVVIMSPEWAAKLEDMKDGNGRPFLEAMTRRVALCAL